MSTGTVLLISICIAVVAAVVGYWIGMIIGKDTDPFG